MSGALQAASKKHIAVMKDIEQLIDSRSNFKNYRLAIKKAQPPFLPFEGKR